MVNNDGSHQVDMTTVQISVHPDTNSKTKEPEGVDLETAIAKTGYGLFNWVMIILILPAASTTVFINVAMSLSIPVIHELDLTSSDKALLQSSSYAGMVMSGYFWGILSDDLGRKKLLAGAFLLDFFLTFGCGTVKSVTVIVVFKFLSGFIIAGPHAIFMVYISEVFSKQHRDWVTQFTGVFTSLGGMIQAVLAMWLLPLKMPSWIPLASWQVFILVCGSPSLIVGVACIFFYESPKFLVEKKNPDAALKVLQKIYSINTGNPPESYPVKRLVGSFSASKKKSFCSRMLESIDLFKNPFLLKTAVSIIIFFILFSNQNTLRLWMPEIFNLLQNSNVTDQIGVCPLLRDGHEQELASTLASADNSVYSKMIIIHSSCLCSHLVYMLLVKKIRKKNLLIFATIVAGVAITISPLLPAMYISVISTIYIAMLEVACYAFMGVVVQIFPTYLRAKSVSLTYVIGRFGIFLGNFILANLIYSYCEYMFYALGVGTVGMLAMIFLLNMTPYDDTKISH